MTDDEVAEFENATSEAHWNDLCDKIKSKYGGYPTNWYARIMLGGVAARAQSRWR
jgi:hypothetical protein